MLPASRWRSDTCINIELSLFSHYGHYFFVPNKSFSVRLYCFCLAPGHLFFEFVTTLTKKVTQINSNTYGFILVRISQIN